GTYVLALSDLTRIVGDRSASVEDVVQLGGNLKWLHAIGERPVAAGIALSAIDAFPLDDQYGALTFRSLGADAVIEAHSGDEHRLTLAFGARQFVYKPPIVPPHSFDWSGPSASARLDWVLWQPPGKTRSLELATTLGFEDRSYKVAALVDACPP